MNPLATLESQAAALAAGTVTSVELTTAALDRIDAAQPVLNTFRMVRREAALAEAAEADARLARGDRAALLGVPTAVKDDTDLAGAPTAFGCDGDFPAKATDSEMVRRLRAAGAVIVGKTNTPEFGQWPFTEAPWFGATRNPWALDRSPGGSSGGTASAVAAGLFAAGIGSDGAGSVRIPASWTNLVGIKPQRGRISTWPDAEAFEGLTVNGPLARTVSDAALLLDVTSGAHPGDLHTPPPPTASFRSAADRDPGRLRIALSTRPAFSGFRTTLDPEIRAGVERVAATFTALGHEVTLGEPDYRLAGLGFMPRSHAGLRLWQGRVPDPALLDPRTRENCRNARAMGGPVLRLARAHERRLQRQVGALFDRVDVVLAPTTAQRPLRIGATDGLSGWRTDRMIVQACPYAWPWNVLGWPGVSVPAGFTSDGLPFGAQLLGPANSEELLISLAAQLESVEHWYERVPPHSFASVG
ncbi:MAG TPA: amidase [Jatrophihabitantaceae bacterium]|nr:amidase [Jatrophihabitantaceae bacterium]